MATAEPGVQNSASRSAQTRSALQSLAPQRRAQVLLLNMAGLTTRLIQLAGNRTGVMPQLLPEAALPPEGTAATTTKDILAILDSHQTLLFETVEELEHLEKMEGEKLRIADAIAAKDVAMREFAKRLRDAQQVLESTLEDFEDYKRPKKAGGQNEFNDSVEIGLGTINIQELVAYAHRISYTTFAPPEFAEGAPLRGALPPAPQEEQMRASKLYQINELELGLPKAVARTASPLMAGDSEVKVEGGATPQNQGAALLPPPAGWKPGMPVELPLELPPMPPGWKPGDPVPLHGDMPPLPPAGWKPGDAVVLPPSFAPFPGVEGSGPVKVTPPPGPAVPLAPPGGPIFVPFVNLDLNPELEDPYGSDYSDEDGSSDDDED
ncbi:unnamed protein product [Calypogeia fissa]